ncbi:uncharacterized protein EAE97_003829 [Botrytis byssoidea]|uniref:Uncharacterized protein n=1 Tax=Botrytis byssoidea TaxID=139641 RepID=A0A9P5IR27_9HELO|nr:uncharacterized protein EAE97_003829 [Botrytis byssoidea]KAF7948418.1 hypothetical protein EAE97_003829 [Botrytis byssoidea]
MEATWLVLAPPAGSKTRRPFPAVANDITEQERWEMELLGPKDNEDNTRRPSESLIADETMKGRTASSLRAWLADYR